MDLLLYDGECALCNRVVQFVLRFDRHDRFRFASLQSTPAAAVLNRFGLIPLDEATFYIVRGFGSSAPDLLAKSRAVLFLLGALGWPWRLAMAVRLLPVAWLDRCYDVLARHRYAWFGREDHCLLPTDQFRARFLEGGDV
jgi:predicted DCC family thiol-disulfide oxidoreductase YuxK